MKSVSQMLQNNRIGSPQKITERGELLRYFADKLNSGRKEKGLKLLTIGAVGRFLTRFKLADLYFIKSDCDDAERRGVP